MKQQKRQLVTRFSQIGSFGLSLLASCSNTLLNLSTVVLILLASVYTYASLTLPNARQLRDMPLQVPLRVYSKDGLMIGEFGERRRIPVKLEQVPQTLIDAVLDVEDQRFFEHKGIDFYGISRAARQLITTGKKQEGGSTITMQVARNFFLNREKTFTRKINEVLLAFSIDKYFTKREILELYLNKIFFGHRAYGIAAAAQAYYGKELTELTIAEQAMLAGLPQTPSRNNPISNPQAALKRRNHVLQRMFENGHLTLNELQTALAEPIRVVKKASLDLDAHYLAEMVRNALFERFGKRVYDEGLEVYTTLDSKLQKEAVRALDLGLIAYERRHEYRGTEGNLASTPQEQWCSKLARYSHVGPLQIAAVQRVVPSVNAEGVEVAGSFDLKALLADGQQVRVTKPSSWEFSWSRGDLIRVYSVDGGKNWRLSQLPRIEGALLAINPSTGAIEALQGGFNFNYNKFNRITSAARQSGSLFKSFLYSAALDNGFTLASIINDVPIVLSEPGKPNWRPQNASGLFYGPTTLRTALVKSRNLVTIRLLQAVGIKAAISHMQKFGFNGKTELPPALSLALGSGSVTPLKLASGYSVFASGGYYREPYFIERIEKVDVRGTKRLVFKADVSEQPPESSRAISEQNAYLINDVLHEVIENGTARRAKALARKDLMGKTGSTNDLVDAWFIGYNKRLLGLVWVGFDQPSSTQEYGSGAALPIWIDFMQKALNGVPEQPMEAPEGIITARVNKRTGKLLAPVYDDEGRLIAPASTENSYLEKFITGQTPPIEPPTEEWEEDDLWEYQNLKPNNEKVEDDEEALF